MCRIEQGKQVRWSRTSYLEADGKTEAPKSKIEDCGLPVWRLLIAFLSSFDAAYGPRLGLVSDETDWKVVGQPVWYASFN